MRRVFFEKSNLTWMIVSALAVTIFIVSSMQFGAGGVRGFALLPILYHFLVFFWLGFFISIASVRGREIKWILPVLFIALFYAVSDEIHQLFVPSRVCSFSDFIVDSAGIFAGIFLYVWTLMVRKKSTSSEAF